MSGALHESAGKKKNSGREGVGDVVCTMLEQSTSLASIITIQA